MHCWWQSRLLQLLLKGICRFLGKVINLLNDSKSILGIYLQNQKGTNLPLLQCPQDCLSSNFFSCVLGVCWRGEGSLHLNGHVSLLVAEESGKQEGTSHRTQGARPGKQAHPVKHRVLREETPSSILMFLALSQFRVDGGLTSPC